MNVYLDYLGCRLNEAELQRWSADFSRHGIDVTREVSKADLIVVNTCAVTGEAARKSRQTIRKLHNKSPAARLVVTGCYASLEEQKVADIFGVDRVINNSDKDNLVNIIVDELSLPTTTIQATEPGESAFILQNRDRAFIKVQDGCRYRCTYCIVTIARGEEKSRSIKELVAEINQLYNNGVFEIVLTGVHVGGYGSDINTNLYQLVETIILETHIPRIRFASVEPWDLPDNFFDLFENKRLMPHMHLPLQSGSDTILKKMSRRCRTEEFSRIVKIARSKIADFNITTDVIVGFPGESEQEWKKSLNFIKTIPLGHIHIFSFSAREGTKAANLPEMVDNATKKSRSKTLHALSEQLKRQQLGAMVNTSCHVLIESDYDTLADGRFSFWGHTENYHKINLLSRNRTLAGSIVEVTIRTVHQSNCYLETSLVRILRPALKSAPLPVLQIGY